MGRDTRADELRDTDEPGGAVARQPLTRGMRWAVAGIAAVVIGGAVWAVWLSTSGDATARPGTTATAGAPASPGAPTEPGTDAEPDDGGTPPSAPGTGGGQPSPDATPVDGSEVLPPAETESPHLPPLPQPTPLVVSPLPKNASAQGELVAGFPADVVGPAPESDVIDSSVTSDGTTLHAALTARTDKALEEIADHYRSLWADLGLAPSGADGDALAYSDTFTSATVAFRESGTGTIYTVYATLRTE